MNEYKTEQFYYLGDAVYLEIMMNGIILRTDSHRYYECGNEIYLEPTVLEKLLMIIEKRKRELKNE